MQSRWSNFCPDDIKNHLATGFELTCFATVDLASRVVTAHEPTSASGCGGDSPHLGIDQALVVPIPEVTGVQDISIAIIGMNQVFRCSGNVTDACSLPTMETGFSMTGGAFASTEMNNLRFTIPAGMLNIQQCGVGCPPYSPNADLNVLSHSCGDNTVAPGTACMVQCPDGYTRAGTEVSCVGGVNEGTYQGEIECTNDAVSLSSCANNLCPALSNVLGSDVTQISGTGCGESTLEGTQCAFSCDTSKNMFSKGSVLAISGTWQKTNDAECLPCEAGTCDAVVTSVQIKDDPNNAGSTAICITGHNFDPMNDRVIVVAGAEAHCGTINAAAIDDTFLDCNIAATACGAPDQNTLACSGFPTHQFPTEGTICLCDADVQGGCTNVHQKYGMRALTFPTLSPTQSPTTCE